MKIALLMSGQTRHFWIALPTIFKNVVLPNNADVFCFLNKNSNCIYSSKPKPMDEEMIFRHALGNSLKEIKFNTDDHYQQEMEHYSNLYCLRTKNYHLKSPLPKTGDPSWPQKIWYYHENTTPQFRRVGIEADAWTKIKRCAEMIEAYQNKNNIKYDIILKIRPDIPFYNEYNINDLNVDTLRVNNRKINDKICWAKEYLYAGNQIALNLSKRVAEEFLLDTDPFIVGDDDLTLTAEVQFAKILFNNKIYPVSLKNHEPGPTCAGRYLKMTHESPYAKYSDLEGNTTQTYLDAGINGFTGLDAKLDF